MYRDPLTGPITGLLRSSNCTPGWQRGRFWEAGSLIKKPSDATPESCQKNLVCAGTSARLHCRVQTTLRIRNTRAELHPLDPSVWLLIVYSGGHMRKPE